MPYSSVLLLCPLSVIKNLDHFCSCCISHTWSNRFLQSFNSISHHPTSIFPKKKWCWCWKYENHWKCKKSPKMQKITEKAKNHRKCQKSSKMPKITKNHQKSPKMSKITKNAKILLFVGKCPLGSLNFEALMRTTLFWKIYTIVRRSFKNFGKCKQFLAKFDQI